MRIYDYPWSTDTRHSGECILALGFFDGVHAAHRDLILCAKKQAKMLGLPLGIFTFRTSAAIKSGTKRIYGEPEKLELFESLGVDFTVTADFDSIRDISHDDFVRNILCRDIGCKICVAGFNFSFGRGALGHAEELVRLMRECGGDAVIRSELCIDGETVSSTLIRRLLEEGEIERANALLGTPYFIKGKVEHGRSVGTKLGYPTVNTELDPALVIPRHGVYCSEVELDGRLYAALTNIGICPTFDERPTHAETYIIDFSGDLYGRNIRVSLLEFLREERRFSSAEELSEQIKKDTQKAKDRGGR